jgi:hypothetical protein
MHYERNVPRGPADPPVIAPPDRHVSHGKDPDPNVGDKMIVAVKGEYKGRVGGREIVEVTLAADRSLVQILWGSDLPR